jgi:acylphosphatase
MTDTHPFRTVHVLIEGRVQGVYYRAWTQQSARELGLSGWVQNRRDGAVEAVFSGDPVCVDTMLRRCEDGPPDALVTNVTVISEGGSVPDGFSVRRTG